MNQKKILLALKAIKLETLKARISSLYQRVNEKHEKRIKLVLGVLRLLLFATPPILLFLGGVSVLFYPSILRIVFGMFLLSSSFLLLYATIYILRVTQILQYNFRRLQAQIVVYGPRADGAGDSGDSVREDLKKMTLH